MFSADTEAIFCDPCAEVVAAEELAATWRVISAYKSLITLPERRGQNVVQVHCSPQAIREARAQKAFLTGLCERNEVEAIER